MVKNITYRTIKEIEESKEFKYLSSIRVHKSHESLQTKLIRINSLIRQQNETGNADTKALKNICINILDNNETYWMELSKIELICTAAKVDSLNGENFKTKFDEYIGKYYQIIIGRLESN